MGKSGRSTRRTGLARRGEDSACLFLPEELELELVGIIGPGDGRSGSGDADIVLLDGYADLQALVKSLRGTAGAGAQRTRLPGRGACSSGDGSLN